MSHPRRTLQRGKCGKRRCQRRSGCRKPHARPCQEQELLQRMQQASEANMTGLATCTMQYAQHLRARMPDAATLRTGMPSSL